ncbi:hypothetical protein NIES25_69290 (plasmid) [Nostoc linckia NIES-25]|nr:hypothetical protein NIES25_69290 [Nostoc linckia NIES-25]
MSQEQHTQAYLNLINQLLSCNDGDGARILQDNQELLGLGLIETMIGVGQELEKQGREYEAQWLIDVAWQLKKYLGLVEDETTENDNIPPDYLNFLMAVLQKIYENPNPQLIYPFLAQNLDKLNESCGEILYQWITNLFTTLNPVAFYELLIMMTIFGNRMQEFPLGDPKSNVEIAIKAFQATLKFSSSDTYSYNWANLQYNLGNAYLKRLKGEEIENIEAAIACYRESLKIYTPNSFPSEWSDAQHNLARAYGLKGEKSGDVELAIACYRESLKIYTPDSFPLEWASTQMTLGHIYYVKRIEGNKLENIEIAISCYKKALKIYTPDSFPLEWASTQMTLGHIYYVKRIEGNKLENIEIAISCYKKALNVYTLDVAPLYWARVQDLLGLIYFESTKEEKKENLEIAIYHFKQSLKVYILDTNSVSKKEENLRWADIQNNLGRAYFARVEGDKGENLEIAIHSYQQSLIVYTLENFPEKWADLQHNLGNVYCNRIKGDKAENLETAICYYHESLKVYPCDTFPKDWALTHNALGLAYSDRIKGDKAENLETAIYYFSESLKIFTFDNFPFEWSSTQNNLGKAYTERIKGEEAENYEAAIYCYLESLKVSIFSDYPVKWASRKMNLGNAYCKRIKGDKAENIENAIATLNEAMKVYTFDAFPYEWALTQNSLGTIYSGRIRGDKANNLEKAIKCYHNTLKICTKENNPLICLMAARNLGILHYEEKQWQLATEAYHLAIEALENARLESLNPQSRKETLSNAIDIFHRIVQAHLNLHQPDRALEYIERSKARNLVELMTQKSLKPQGVDRVTIAQWDELRQRVVNEQIRLQSQSINQNLNFILTDNLAPYVTDQSRLKEYQQELDNFIEHKITPIDPTFKLTQKVEPISFKEIQVLIDPETCLLEWYITREKILAFVVSADRNIQYWESSETDFRALINTFINYFQLYYSQKGKQEWIDQVPNLLQTFADIIHINDILTLIPDTCKRLIIIPHLYLHILPIHGLPISNSLIFNGSREGSELHDLFPKGVQYAPSCQLLQIAQTFHHSEFNQLFAIQNPTKDLLYTDLEVNALINFFAESRIFIKDNATKDIVTSHLQSSDYHCYHFSCHGRFNLYNPLESALFLANNEPLSLNEIFELNLKKSSLVVLSACETGLTDFQSLSDEYIGLTSGFLFAGSRNVVSSLWTVSDLSTSFLIIKFYEILFDETQQFPVAVALKEAQHWLQNLTIEELDKFLEQYKLQLEKTLAQLRIGQRRRVEESLKQIRQRQPYPFANPYYWAAFTATGA